ncbi:MFS transporter [Microbaculum marinum]|uniref:MFS transporter n=1 Tax=Microbaculum marinum TaxID=1764581 RepID=A0AAW9RJ04_9HYPH
MDRNRFAWSLSVYYSALFLIIGLMLPYLPLWIESRGLSPTQISVILTIPMVVRLGAIPVMTFLADRMPARQVALLIYSVAAATLLFVFHLTEGFWVIAAAVAVVAVFLTPLLPITEAVAMRGARLYALDYGRIRLWGSLSFIAANIIGGAVVARGGGAGALLALNAAAVLTAIAAFALPRREPASDDAPVAAQKPVRGNMRELYGLLRQPRFAAVLIGSGLIQSSHGMFYAFGTIGWVEQGISPSTVGFLWATGVLVEVCLFAVAARIVATLGIGGLFAAGAIAAVLRWSLMVAEWPVAVYFPIQALHALTFGATHLATMNYLTREAPDHHAGSAQGLFFTLYGLMTGTATLAAGPLFRTFGSGGYAAMAIWAGAGGLILLVTLRPRRT